MDGFGAKGDCVRGCTRSASGHDLLGDLATSFVETAVRRKKR